MLNMRLVQDYYRNLYSPQCDAALREYVSKRLIANTAHRIIIHHVIAEGDFVFLFVEEKLNAGVDVARAGIQATQPQGRRWHRRSGGNFASAINERHEDEHVAEARDS